MDPQSGSNSTVMELYESTVEDLCESRYKYSNQIRKNLSDITDRDILRMKKMKFSFERSHARLPDTKINFQDSTNYGKFSGESSLQTNQCKDLRNEIMQLKEKLRRMKSEE